MAAGSFPESVGREVWRVGRADVLADVGAHPGKRTGSTRPQERSTARETEDEENEETEQETDLYIEEPNLRGTETTPHDNIGAGKKA
jgi:hypothetical protein